MRRALVHVLLIVVVTLVAAHWVSTTWAWMVAP